MAIWPFGSSPSLVLGNYAEGLPLLPGRLTLGPAEIATHKHVIGLTGQGKSKFLASTAVQLLNQGQAFGLIDPHSDLAADILWLLQSTKFFDHPEAFKRLIYVDFGRTDRFLPFNVLAPTVRFDAHTIARHIVEVCKRAWPALADGSAPQFENILLASVVVLVDNRLPLTALPSLLTDKPYRDQLLANVSDPLVVEFFRARFDSWGKDTSLMIESTLRRVFLLTFSPTLRHTLGQTGNSLDFRQLMDDGVSVIFDLGGLDEETQRFLGCLLTVGFEVAALSRADLPERDRRHYQLILDEFSMFSAQSEDALARVLSLARKYGLYLTLAHQTWSQVSERLRGALQNAVEIAFKLGRSDAEWAAPRFARYDPFLIKHQVVNLLQVERTHPLYFSIQETVELWAQELTSLQPRQAFAKVGDRVAKIRTLDFPSPTVDRQALLDLKERYAEALLTPKADVAAQVGLSASKPPQSTQPTITRRRKLQPTYEGDRT